MADAFIERRLAACVNIVPQIESVYRWQGKVETATEWLLVIKTTANRFAPLRDALHELHSYVNPECIAIELADGSVAYLEWIAESVR